MTDNTQKLDEQISDILAAIYLAGTENGLGRQLTDPAEIMHRKEAFINANPASTEAKLAILDWHNKQVEEAVREARVDELRHIVSGSRYSADDFYWYEKTEDEYVGNSYYSEVYHLTKDERITELYKESKND